MPKTASINIRVEPSIKDKAEELYNDFGISLSDAINIFLKKSIDEGGLPFALKKEKPRLDMSKLVFADPTDNPSAKIALKDDIPFEWPEEVKSGSKKTTI